jgi:hypothetical protein
LQLLTEHQRQERAEHMTYLLQLRIGFCRNSFRDGPRTEAKPPA